MSVDAAFGLLRTQCVCVLGPGRAHNNNHTVGLCTLPPASPWCVEVDRPLVNDFLGGSERETIGESR